MKLKTIILGLLFLIIPYFDYLCIYNYYTLNNKNFSIYSYTSEGASSIVFFTISCMLLFASLIYLILENWNKTITPNSILKTIKSIKLN